jgi:hypothetical protein
MKRQEKKNPKDSLIYLTEFVECFQAQVLVDNGATSSFINENFAQKLLLKYILRKFKITLRNGQVCYTKGEVSLDLRLAETTYDILLVMDLMEKNCVNSEFYRTQEEPRKGIEINKRRFIHDP